MDTTKLDRTGRSYALLAIICEDEIKTAILRIMGTTDAKIRIALRKELDALREARDAMLIMLYHFLGV